MPRLIVFSPALNLVRCIFFIATYSPCLEGTHDQDDGKAATIVPPMVQNWAVELIEDNGKYKVEFRWEHVHDNTVVVDHQAGLGKVTKPTEDPRCSGESEKRAAADNQPFWMPRFNPREVPANVTAATGIKFASIDWQPCGHKDITICHAESHYDIHFYYVTEDTLNNMPDCQIGSEFNRNLPICQDMAKKENHDYFKLVRNNLPKSYKKSYNNFGGLTDHNVNFCVDPSSAILKSGVHYGDRSETLDEWKSPVTIVGSHDCKLLFFEPMISWKWISNNVRRQESWPKFEVRDITYNRKTFKPLPDSWTVEVSSGCKTNSVFATTTRGTCAINLTLIGDSCALTPDAVDCKPVAECDDFKSIIDCKTGGLYKTPFNLSLWRPILYPESPMETHTHNLPEELFKTVPTASPTESPRKATPTAAPTETPTEAPTQPPYTAFPTAFPTESPTELPTQALPTMAPTVSNTETPTEIPTQPLPTVAPTASHTASPTEAPTQLPAQQQPTLQPTNFRESPTATPTKSTMNPGAKPTEEQSTGDSGVDLGGAMSQAASLLAICVPMMIVIHV